MRPNEVRLLNLAAQIHYRQGKLALAETLLRKSLAINPKQPKIAKVVEALARDAARRP